MKRYIWYLGRKMTKGEQRWKNGRWRSARDEVNIESDLGKYS